jgi:hypothetical protein
VVLFSRADAVQVTGTRVGSRADMSTELWRLPVPATALVKKPALVSLPGRQCEIYFHVEHHDGIWKRFSILFVAVEAFKCTYFTSCTAEMLAASGKLLDLGDTPWLCEVCNVQQTNARPSKQLRHLIVCLDRGPCYEFICADYVLSF